MEKTNKAVTAGILAIISGAIGLIIAASYFIGFGVTSGYLGIPTGYIPAFVPGIVLGMAILALIVAILALAGGIYAVQKKDVGSSTSWFNCCYPSVLPLGNSSHHTHSTIQG